MWRFDEELLEPVRKLGRYRSFGIHLFFHPKMERDSPARALLQRPETILENGEYSLSENTIFAILPYQWQYVFISRGDLILLSLVVTSGMYSNVLFQSESFQRFGSLARSWNGWHPSINGIWTFGIRYELPFLTVRTEQQWGAMVLSFAGIVTVCVHQE